MTRNAWCTRARSAGARPVPSESVTASTSRTVSPNSSPPYVSIHRWYRASGEPRRTSSLPTSQ
ncbi:MAG TPA: hypothetical protein VFB06_22045 [Streptosporangiaceae bacterium]|nr:hypothetical protein [Streptosporangiaceae bacterium]